MLAICVKLVCRKKLQLVQVKYHVIYIALVLDDVDRDEWWQPLHGWFNILGRISGKCMHKHHLHVDA